MRSKRLEKVPAKHKKHVEAQLRLLSKTLQERREHAGLSQERLAEELGISTSTIQFVEQGRRYPSLPLLFSLLSHLKISFRLE